MGTKNAQCIYWDQQLPGFGVRVYPNGRRVFVCSYRVQGRKRLATLGRGDILRLDVARKKAVSYLGQVAEGIDPQAPKDTLKAAGTVKSLAEAYIGRHAKLKKNTWVEDELYLTRHLLPRFGTRLALAITTDDMAALHAQIGSKHPYAANRLLEIVRKMYNLGRKWGLVPIERPIQPLGSSDSLRPSVGGLLRRMNCLGYRKQSTKRPMSTFGTPYGFCCSPGFVAESC